MNGGFIKFYRSILDHWTFKEKREFSRFEAFFYIVIRANYADSVCMCNNEMVVVKRGQMLTSKESLGERFLWSRTKVTKFLNTLQADGSITYKSTSRYTLITVENFEFFQGDGEKKDIQKTSKRHPEDIQSTSERHPEDIQETSKVHPKDTSKEELRRIKKEKKEIYGKLSNVKLTETDRKKLDDALGEELAAEMIDRLSLYIASKGDKYKSHYATILNWSRSEPKPVRSADGNRYGGVEL